MIVEFNIIKIVEFRLTMLRMTIAMVFKNFSELIMERCRNIKIGYRVAAVVTLLAYLGDYFSFSDTLIDILY